MKIGILFGIILCLLACPVLAVDDSVPFWTPDGLDQALEAIPEQAQDAINGLTMIDALDFSGSLQKLIGTSKSLAMHAIRESFSGIMQIFVIAAVCSVTAGLYYSGKYDVVTICGASSILLCAVRDVLGVGSIAKETLEELNVFSKALLPVLTAASAATGAVTAASFRHTAMLFLTDVVITGMHSLLMPLTYTCIAIAGANAIGGNDALDRIGDLLKRFVASALRIGLTLYVTILGLSGVISGSVDAITAKTIKLTVSSAIPIVGGIVADASETVLAGALTAKNTVGVFGILVIVGTVLFPVIRIGAMYAAYKVAAALSSICVKGELIRLIDAIGSAFGILFGMTGAGAVLLLVSVFAAIVGNGV